MHDEWGRLKLSSAYKRLSSSKDGLSDEEAMHRLLRHGKNEIIKVRKTSALRILLAQFTSPLIIILIAAALVSLAVGMLPESEPKVIDATLILLIVAAVGISGFFQDWKAERSIEALRRMSTPAATVIRNGKEAEIPATEIVPGDIVILNTGDVLPADGKVIESFNMMIDESILTGESRAVRRGHGSTVSMNTSLLSGHGKMLVFATGMGTEVGKLAGKMEEIEDTKTPFQRELASFSKKIFWMVVAISALVMLAGYFRYGMYIAFLTSISLAVAAIPEGLPAVVTLALALGAKSMVSSNALIRKLPVVESVGSVNVICTDKTGTLTKNRMSVTRIFFDEAVYDVGEINRDDAKRMEKLFLCSAVCNDTKVVKEGTQKKLEGDQTEVALTEFAMGQDFPAEDMKEEYIRVNEIPFTSKRKMMTVACKHGKKEYVFSKGAPEILLHRCNRILSGNRTLPLDEKTKHKILKQDREFASHSLRVLAFAYKEKRGGISEKHMEEDLVFLGLEGMLDPPRDEVREALSECRSAGIRVVMITGDNIETAKAIANEIGLKSRGAVSGSEMDHLTNEQLERKLSEGVNIFARTSPFDKLRILEILQKYSRVIMTGDGVNDALALKKADVGIAMGERGTEVAKEASDIILVDDNFATIRNAIREGRRIFDNIRKFVNYQLTCHLAEVIVIFTATLLFTLEEPVLLPVHILWINMLTDGIPAIALGVDPALPGIMKRGPRDPKEGILDKGTVYSIVAMGVNLAVLLFLVYVVLYPMGTETARSALFTGFVLYEFMKIMEIRHNEELGFLDNRMLLVALLVSIALQLSIVYTPLNVYFSLVPLGLYEWTVLLAFAALGWLTSMGTSRLISRLTK
jgi:Ca2+-transporting ATPase